MRIKQATRAIATAVATAMLAVTAITAAPTAVADTGDTTVSSQEIAAAIGNTDNANGALIAEPAPSTTTAELAAVTTTQDGATVEVPRDPEDGVSLQTEGSPEVTIGLPGEAGDAKRLPDGTVAFPGSDGSAQAVIPTETGVQMVTTIANADAPTRYTYKVDVPSGGRVEVLPDNAGAAVIDGEGNTLLAIPSPWAKDTEGVAVRTSFETNGTSLPQVVDHTSEGYDYPVVADPVFAVVVAIATSIAIGCIVGASQNFAQNAIKQAIKRGDWH